MPERYKPEKYREEIEEILKRAGEAAPRGSPGKLERPPEDRPRESLVRRRAPGPKHRGGRRLPSITPGKLMLAGVVLFLIGIKVWPLIWVGLATLLGAYLLYFVTPRSISYEKRWRGQPIDEGYTSPWERIKRWLKG